MNKTSITHIYINKYIILVQSQTLENEQNKRKQLIECKIKTQNSIKIGLFELFSEKCVLKRWN